jgi:hypothetical protein
MPKISLLFLLKWLKLLIDVDILIELQNWLVDYCDNNNNIWNSSKLNYAKSQSYITLNF